MKKTLLSLCFLGSLVASSCFASDISVKGLKPFVGGSIGFLSNPIGSALIGISGGAEYNFTDRMGVRAYLDVRYSPSISATFSTSSTPSRSIYMWFFTGTVDFVYRVNSKLGLFIGLGVGDIFVNDDITVLDTSNRTIDYNGSNYLSLLTSLGIQYNIDAKNLLELDVKLYARYNFGSGAVATVSTGHPSLSIKYVYRF